MAKKQKASASEDLEQVSFEDSLAQVEDVVRELEDGQLGLNDSLARYESGIKALKSCYQTLEAAERKIELLTGVDAEGNPVTQPFDDQEMTLDEKAKGRSKRRTSANDNVDESDTLF